MKLTFVFYGFIAFMIIYNKPPFPFLFIVDYKSRKAKLNTYPAMQFIQVNITLSTEDFDKGVLTFNVNILVSNDNELCRALEIVDKDL